MIMGNRTANRPQLCLVSLLVGASCIPGWCQGQQDAFRLQLLKTAVEQADDGMGPIELVHFDTRRDPPWPEFRPIGGLDSPAAVPFLMDVLNNGPAWTDRALLDKWDGVFPHVARCYAALCLGVIGDHRAFDPLIQSLQYRESHEEKYILRFPQEVRYYISEHAALALGYLGDPNAVQPLMEALRKDKREWAIHALTQLGDARAVKPIIDYVADTSDQGRLFSLNIYTCLEYITRSYPRIKDLHQDYAYESLDFPEIGRLKSDRFYQAFWQYWLKAGDKLAKRQFEDGYRKWKILRKERPDDQVSQRAVLEDMLRQGILSLPYAIEKIEGGDESLVAGVVTLTGRNKSARLKEGVSRVECLHWWAKDRAKCAIQFGEASDPNDKAGEVQSSGTRPSQRP